MDRPIEDHSLDQLFRNARSHSAWTDAGVSETELRAIYDNGPPLSVPPTVFNAVLNRAEAA